MVQTLSINNAYLSIPESGQGPGILLLHAWWGLNDLARQFADRLAQNGFTVLAPDLYHGATANDIEGAERLRKAMNSNQAKRELRQAAQDLASLDSTQGENIGLIGFSLGAFFGLWLADEFPDLFSAVVVFYGTRSGKKVASRAALLGHFAETDPYESDLDRDNLEKLWRKAGREVQLYTYPGTGHWFFEADRQAAYQPEAAHLAWERTLAFLKRHLEKPAHG